MNTIKIIEELGKIEGCEDIARDLTMIEVDYQRGILLKEEREILIHEIRDVRSAHECNENIVAFQAVIQLCNALLSKS